MDPLDLPEDLQDVEIIYSDGEEDFDDDNEPIEGFDDDEEIREAFDENIEINDMSILTFTGHTQGVFTSDLSQDGQLAITGGEDDMAYLWSPQTKEVVLECTGHKDSVTHVSFNHDCQLVATGDMSGLIQVWSITEKKLLWCNDGDDMEWMTWHHLTNVIITGSQSGNIYIWQVPSGNLKVLPSHGSSCTCGRLLPDGTKLVAGYGDGTVKMWDIKATSTMWQHSTSAGVTSLELSLDGLLLSTAPTAELIKISDGKMLGTLLVEGETEIEAHVFHPELNILVTGSLTGQLCTWDVSKQAMRHRAKIECAVTVFRLRQDGHLYVGGADGVIYLCDVKSGSLINALTGHRAEVLSLGCFKQDPDLVLSTSEDSTCKIFKHNIAK